MCVDISRIVSASMCLRVCVCVLCGTQMTKLLKLPSETLVALTLPQVDVATDADVVAVVDS